MKKQSVEGHRLGATRVKQVAGFGSLTVMLMALAWTGCVRSPVNYEDLNGLVAFYWKMRMETTYEYPVGRHVVSLYDDLLDPEVRKHYKRQEIYNHFNLHLSNWQLVDIEYKKPDEAAVHSQISFEFRGFDMKHVKVTDRWVKRDGRWYWSPMFKKGPF